MMKSFAVVLLCLCVCAHADRQLDEEQYQQLFGKWAVAEGPVTGLNAQEYFDQYSSFRDTIDTTLEAAGEGFSETFEDFAEMTLGQFRAIMGEYAKNNNAPLLSSSASGVIYVIRHGEKKDGCESKAGLARAAKLYDVFKDKYQLPKYIFANKYNTDGCQRCEQTVEPIAKKLGLKVDMHYGRSSRFGGNSKAAKAMIAQLEKNDIILTAWEHNNIKALTEYLGVSSHKIPTWENSDYNSVYQIKYSGGKVTSFYIGKEL